MRQVELKKSVDDIMSVIAGMPTDEKIVAINDIKQRLHDVSPFCSEPVDCVIWVKADCVTANEYNPNKVAPPEMELLEVSIVNDGYTQPIVTWAKSDGYEVVDGFHRSRVGKESPLVAERIQGYLPVVAIRKEQQGKNDRIASTIRHNRARGKHQVDAMSEIVLELKNRNWTNKRIARELGMDEDEILRLCQITGLEHLFTDHDFSRAWEAADSEPEDDFIELTNDIPEEIAAQTRTANTSDPNRVFHTHDKWECVKAGFYASTVEGKSKEQCQQEYAAFLSDQAMFAAAIEQVFEQWPNSCEHYLTNAAMNRIAWLGQAAMCVASGIPSQFCSGFNLLSLEQQDAANETALRALNKWLASRGMDVLSMEQALSYGRQVEIY